MCHIWQGWFGDIHWVLINDRDLVQTLHVTDVMCWPQPDNTNNNTEKNDGTWDLLPDIWGFVNLFSVIKVTLQSQMSVCLSVHHKAKTSNSLKSVIPWSFIIRPTSFIILHHPSFISQLLSFSACLQSYMQFWG